MKLLYRCESSQSCTVQTMACHPVCFVLKILLILLQQQGNMSQHNEINKNSNLKDNNEGGSEGNLITAMNVRLNAGIKTWNTSSVVRVVFVRPVSGQACKWRTGQKQKAQTTTVTVVLHQCLRRRRQPVGAAVAALWERIAWDVAGAATVWLTAGF